MIPLNKSRDIKPRNAFTPFSSIRGPQAYSHDIVSFPNWPNTSTEEQTPLHPIDAVPSSSNVEGGAFTKHVFYCLVYN